MMKMMKMIVLLQECYNIEWLTCRSPSWLLGKTSEQHVKFDKNLDYLKLTRNIEEHALSKSQLSVLVNSFD